MDYRRDIDGLRAIAVSLVILNHVGFSFLPGGFVGVDVFFVISGYLITRIIKQKIDTSEFSFAWFYVRRIKRLMPVLFCVLLVSSLVFSAILLPADLVRFYKSLISVELNLSNFFFWREHGGYFGGNAAESPLLHTWSLAIEEQYYLVWPLALLIATRVFSGRLLPFLLVTFTVFLVWLSEIGTQISFGASYYLLPTRFFELLAGSCLAYFSVSSSTFGPVARNLLGIAGMGLVVGSALILTEHSTFPGINAAWPVLGTVALIVSIGSGVNSLLSLSAFVWVGKISYSMYLWHWPIIVYVRYVEVQLTLLVQVACIALTILLSYLSWRFVEEPFRRSKRIDFRSVLSRYYLAPGVILAVIAIVGIANRGYPERFDDTMAQMERAIGQHSTDLPGNCHNALRHSEVPPSFDCFAPFNDYSTKKRVLLIGDSHGNHLLPTLELLADSAHAAVLDYTMDQCPPILQIDWGGSAYKAARCRSRNEAGFGVLEDTDFDYVVLAASWPGPETMKTFIDGERVTSLADSQAAFEGSLAASIERVIESGARPVLVEDTHDLGEMNPKCPLKKRQFGRPEQCSVTRPANEYFRSVSTRLEENYTSLIVLRPRDFLCVVDECMVEADGIPLFRDDNHLNVEGARILGKRILGDYGNPFEL